MRHPKCLIMKKMSVLIAILFAISANAQEKVAYLDLYQRGSWNHPQTTLLYNNRPMSLGYMNLGSALNMLADQGWVVKETMNVQRFSFVTRHKLHVILEKRYNEGENPFEGLGRSKTRTTSSLVVHKVMEVKPVADTIFYTSTKNKVANVPTLKKQPYYVDNVYVNGKGIISFKASTGVIPKFSFMYANINSITLSENVTEIGQGAFLNGSIESIYFKSTVPALLDGAVFHGKTKLYVPSSAVEQYQLDDGWSRYADQIIGYDVAE